MYQSPANTGYADNFWGCPNPANYDEPTNHYGELYGEWEARIEREYRAQAIAQIRSDLQRYDNCEQELAELAAAEQGEGNEDTENDIWATILEIAQANRDTF